MNLTKISLIAVLLAVTLSFVNNGLASWGNMMFRLDLFDRQAEKELVREEVRQYNAVSASFYSTAGESTAGLDVIPAAPLLKRRLYKDINMLKADGFVMVFDRDRTDIRRIYFPERDLSAAEVDEVWAVSLQDLKSRKSVFNVKAVEVRVRYLFRKQPFLKSGKRWIAYAVDVYPEGEAVPEFSRGSSI